jgi:hypothetical protein
MAIASEQVHQVIAAIRSAAAIGLAGDGKIFVTGVESAVRTRTGERGEPALEQAFRASPVMCLGMSPQAHRQAYPVRVNAAVVLHEAWRQNGFAVLTRAPKP